MSRSAGVTDGVRTIVLDLEPVFALLTQLGDAWFQFAFIALLLLAMHRRRQRIAGLHPGQLFLLAGLLLVAYALLGTTKEILAAPRPPGAGSVTVPDWFPATLGPVYTDFATAHGFGFPSGHATTATVFFVGLAMLLDWRTRRVRLGLAACLSIMVGLTRLGLGVHYVVDVVAGFGLGVGIVAAGLLVADHPRIPGLVFVAAAIVTGVGLASLGPTPDLLMTGGGILGVGVLWMAISFWGFPVDSPGEESAGPFEDAESDS